MLNRFVSLITLDHKYQQTFEQFLTYENFNVKGRRGEKRTANKQTNSNLLAKL